MKSITIPSNVVQIVSCASAETPVRFVATTGVHISIVDNSYEIVCTDGRVLAIISGPHEGKDEPSLEPMGDSWACGIVAKDDFERIFNVIPDQPKDGDEVTIPTATFCFGTGGNVLECTDKNTGAKHRIEAKQVEGRYPDIEKVMPKGKPLATIDVDPGLLAELLTVVDRLFDDDGTTPRVTIHVHETMMQLRAKNERGQEFIGLIRLLTEKTS